MKKIVSLILCLFLITGCFKRDTMEDIDIYTTIYPIEYITNRLYGNNSNIYSIYPDGINLNIYEKLTNKQIEEYSNSTLFIFNGLSNEADYVAKFYEHNKKLKFIDAAASMKYQYEIEQLWLDPSNFLMLAQNVKNGLNEYITNHYLRNEISENYEQLKIEVSLLESKLRTMIDEADEKTIIVSNNTLNFLQKYDIEVISLDEENQLTEKFVNDTIELINSGSIKFILAPKNEVLSDTVNKIVEKTKIEVKRFHTLDNITADERSNKKDYISIMNDNIELLKEELYRK